MPSVSPGCWTFPWLCQVVGHKAKSAMCCETQHFFLDVSATHDSKRTCKEHNTLPWREQMNGPKKLNRPIYSAAAYRHGKDQKPANAYQGAWVATHEGRDKLSICKWPVEQMKPWNSQIKTMTQSCKSGPLKSEKLWTSGDMVRPSCSWENSSAQLCGDEAAYSWTLYCMQNTQTRQKEKKILQTINVNYSGMKTALPKITARKIHLFAVNTQM